MPARTRSAAKKTSSACWRFDVLKYDADDMIRLNDLEKAKYIKYLVIGRGSEARTLRGYVELSYTLFSELEANALIATSELYRFSVAAGTRAENRAEVLAHDAEPFMEFGEGVEKAHSL